jgi:hypothetical protein
MKQSPKTIAAKKRKQSEQKIQALLHFVNNETDGEFEYEWENHLGQAFANLVDAMTTEDWQYFETKLPAIHPEDLYKLGDYFCVYPSYYTMDSVLAKRILCWIFLRCTDEDAYQLSHDVTIELGTYVDLKLSLLEKIRQRFEALLVYTTTCKPERNTANLGRNIEFIKEKVANTKSAHNFET